MNARSGAEGAPKGPVRKRLARLIEPAVPRQSRRTGRHEELSGPGLVHGPGHPCTDSSLHDAAAPGVAAAPSGAVAPTGVLDGRSEEPAARGGEPAVRDQEAAEPTAAEAETPAGSTGGPDGATFPPDPESGKPVHPGDDPLEHPSAQRAADAAALENLLRCWVRETGLTRPEDGILRVPLAATGTTLAVPVRHWSPVGCHRFDPPTLDRAPDDAPPLEAVALAALIGREATHGARPAPEPESAALVGRVADSLQRTAVFISERRAHPERPEDTCPFLDGEQALLFGHPLHPTPKSREGLSEGEARVFSPELRGSFPLRWMAVDPSVLAGDSAWTDRGKPVPAAELARRMAGPALSGRLPEGRVPLPLHPWQARELSHSPAVAVLLEAGLLHDLGQGGERWYPTSSVRTVFRPGGTAMLKLSLGLRITNSRRENLRKELLRGVEVHRLLRGDLGAAWRAAHPGFDIVRDPAWLGVDLPGEGRLHGFDTVIRHNPFGPSDDAVCVAGLTAPVPDPAGPPMALRSRLARVIASLAARTGRPSAAVAAEWFLRYLDAVVRPILWLDAHAGIALEAHQQNTLVLLDAEGWPEGGRYRDNQGYYFRASRREELDKRLPGTGLGVSSDTFVADDVTDERFAYYLGINNVLGLIGAFGAQRLADEHLLLAAFRRFLEGAARGSGDEPVSPLPALLLESSTLRCKANLLTRLHGMDELVGPVDTQSVYVTLDNPLAL
ncbi:iron transporter [Streptomyces sp. NBC_01186]|uniref:IucA/IucC family protein n=1 Tax=Streptomyces sp. NBC_01186 TaxID=2903765 RepID=UPI002E15F7D3|nr:iron transporter [Streptomyces sp. NBC_01186]